jgi:hypothetical protein
LTFAPTVAIWVQGPVDPGERSILKRLSLTELSFQERLIWVDEKGAAKRPDGAIGMVWGVVALAVFEAGESVAFLAAKTR